MIFSEFYTVAKQVLYFPTIFTSIIICLFSKRKSYILYIIYINDKQVIPIGYWFVFISIKTSFLVLRYWYTHILKGLIFFSNFSSIVYFTGYCINDIRIMLEKDCMMFFFNSAQTNVPLLVFYTRVLLFFIIVILLTARNNMFSY